jgi:hypothetical protein
MLYCQYRIYKENDDVLEFRQNKKHLYFSIVVGLVLFLYCGIRWIDSIAFLFAISVGVLFLLLGSAPIFSNREIIIDKKKKELLFIVGARRFYSRIKIIPFKQINHIEIEGSPFDTNESWKDTIYLSLKGKNRLKLSISGSEEYSNKFTYKLSETIGCKVIYVR